MHRGGLGAHDKVEIPVKQSHGKRQHIEAGRSHTQAQAEGKGGGWEGGRGWGEKACGKGQMERGGHTKLSGR